MSTALREKDVDELVKDVPEHLHSYVKNMSLKMMSHGAFGKP